MTSIVGEVGVNRLDQTKFELRRIVEEDLGRDAIEEIRVATQENLSGEPAFYIGVTMKSAKDVPDTLRQSELTHRLRAALIERDDHRFPYLFLNASDYESGPGDSDEPLDDDIRSD